MSVTSARDITEAVRPPRAVYLDWPLGHQGGGRPFDAAGQRRVIKDALRTLETITEPGTIVDLPYAWGGDPETIWRESLHPETPAPTR